MGKDLREKKLGVGIRQRKDGLYTARFTDRLGKRRQQYFKKLQEYKNWLANAQFQNKHRGIYAASNMTVNAWFDYWEKYGTIQTSDRTKKTHINSLEIQKVKVIRYKDENGKKLENPIEEVIEGEYDYALRYDEFIAPLIKVVQEQQKMIEQQQRMIEQQQIAIKNQQKEIEQIKKELSKMDSSM
ncbi:MAG: hypothetical protein HFJ03_05460 [Lachnospira sp.]|nr:hypothetical protein [Lachnospira sp.]